MSSFLGSPASVGILVDTPQSSQATLGHTQVYANTSGDLLDMDQQSSPRIAGAKSPRRNGTSALFQNRARKAPIADSALQETAADLKRGDAAQSSARQADQADDIDSRLSPHELSYLDGGSLDQRSLAMSTEFFDAEEALESASDVSTQPDDSLGLRERLQQEIRMRLQAQEALAALQAERNELLERLNDVSRKEAGSSDAMNEGSKEKTQSPGIAGLSSGVEVDASKTAVQGVAALGSEDGLKPHSRDADGAAEIESESVAKQGRAGKEDAEPSTFVDSQNLEERLDKSREGIENTAGVDGVATVEGGAVLASTEVGTARASLGSSGGEEAELTQTGVKGGVEGAGSDSELREALGRKDSEIAKLRVKLDYWEQVNEEYRVQREEAKEKKREERRRLRRRRSWTLGLLGASVGLCVIGGAAYGAYRYWYVLPRMSVDSECSTGTPGPSDVELPKGAPLEGGSGSVAEPE